MAKDLLEKYNLKPVKHLGQNFLINDAVLEKIVTAANLSPNDTVLEIGPGLGILTFALARKVKRVIAIEKDKKLAEILNHELRIRNIKNVELINGDVLRIQNSRFANAGAKFKIQNYKIVANIPYYLTSPLIRKFLEMENRPETMILMLQKEVAQRICTQPPKMSLLSIMVQFYAGPKIIAEVSKKSFHPEPKVDSIIIEIIPKKDLPKINIEKFFSLVKAGFSAKRKFLINNLMKKLKLPKSELQNKFSEFGFDEKIRAENLSVEKWLKIYENLENNL